MRSVIISCVKRFVAIVKYNQVTFDALLMLSNNSSTFKVSYFLAKTCLLYKVEILIYKERIVDIFFILKNCRIRTRCILVPNTQIKIFLLILALLIPFCAEKRTLRRSYLHCFRVLQTCLWSNMWSEKRSPN